MNRIKSSKDYYEYQFKILLVGDSGVGKTSLLMRFADDKFSVNFISTIGIDFRFRTVNIDGHKIKLQSKIQLLLCSIYYTNRLIICIT